MVMVPHPVLDVFGPYDRIGFMVVWEFFRGFILWV
jgi:hypothetical protein